NIPESRDGKLSAKGGDTRSTPPGKRAFFTRSTHEVAAEGGVLGANSRGEMDRRTKRVVVPGREGARWEDGFLFARALRVPSGALGSWRPITNRPPRTEDLLFGIRCYTTSLHAGPRTTRTSCSPPSARGTASPWTGSPSSQRPPTPCSTPCGFS